MELWLLEVVLVVALVAEERIVREWPGSRRDRGELSDLPSCLSCFPNDDAVRNFSGITIPWS